MIHIVENPPHLSEEQVIALYGSVGWGDHDARLIQGIQQSSFVAVAMAPQGEMVGLVRVLSDECFVAWIAELVVGPMYQRQGIGTRLLRAVTERYSSLAIYAETSEDLRAFVMKNGLIHRPRYIVVSKAPI